MSAFGEFIRRERQARCMTQRELAWRLRTTKRVVGSWERGERAPNRVNADKLFRWLLSAPSHLSLGRTPRLGFIERAVSHKEGTA